MAGNNVWCWALSPAYLAHMKRRKWVMPWLFSSREELAEFYNASNLVYFHPQNHSAESLRELASYDALMGNVGDPLELKDVAGQEAKAKELSRASKDVPNVIGGMVDDFSSAVRRGAMPAAVLQGTYKALKKHNPSLLLAGVVYTKDLSLDLTEYAPLLDVVNLWVWKHGDLEQLDTHVQTAREVFGGKAIHLGLYMYDYGDTCDMLPMEFVRFQFERARRFLANGLISGIHMLGSYLKAEFDTEQAKWAAGFLRENFPKE